MALFLLFLITKFIASPAHCSSAPTIYSAQGFYDGPAWDPIGQQWLFTSYGKNYNQIFRVRPGLKVEPWASLNRSIAGTAISATQRFLGADFRQHQILSYKITSVGLEDEKILAHAAFLQPNDVVEGTGWLYATDPDFSKEIRSAVWAIHSASGEAKRVITNMKLPNGIGISPDHRFLYVSDSADKKVYRFKVGRNGEVYEDSKQLFFAPTAGTDEDADGLAVDGAGNVYALTRGSLWAIDPEGKVLARKVLPNFGSNLAVGGRDGLELLVTGQNAVYLYSLPLTD